MSLQILQQYTPVRPAAGKSGQINAKLTRPAPHDGSCPHTGFGAPPSLAPARLLFSLGRQHRSLDSGGGHSRDLPLTSPRLNGCGRGLGLSLAGLCAGLCSGRFGAFLRWQMSLRRFFLWHHLPHLRGCRRLTLGSC